MLHRLLRSRSGSLPLPVVIALHWILLGITIADAAAPPTPPGDPEHFILVGDRLICCDQEQGFPLGRHAPVAGSGQGIETLLNVGSQYSVQYHVAYDAFWLVTRESGSHDEHSAAEYMCRYPLKDLMANAGKTQADEDSRPEWRKSCLTLETAGGEVRMLGDGSGFTRETYTDFMVTGPYAVRQFVLANHAGPYGDVAEASPVWSFKAYSYKTGWDERAKKWKDAKWELEGSLPMAFREPFQLLTRGGDYYFITRSGKVFLCAKPPKGKEREMKCIWSDKTRKVVGLVTDAKTGRSFLFCRAPAGERPSYFELAPKPRPVPYGAKAVEWPEYQPMIATGRAYARALIANGKVKLPAKPDGKK